MNTKKNIFWIASYPKSGNTWFRLLLDGVTNKENEEININDINSTEFIASNRQIIDRISGANMADLTEEEIFNIRSEAYKILSESNDKTMYIKTHDAWQKSKQGTELFPNEVTKGVVLIVRNPFDVSVSLSNHTGLSIKESIEVMNNSDYCLSRDPSKLSSQLSMRISSWSEHYRSWVDFSGLDVLIIRYEDLHLNSMQTLSRAFDFLGLKVSNDIIKSTIKRCSFEKLRAQEKENGFREKPSISDKFFKLGKMGYWEEFLDETDVKTIGINHSEILTRLNYQ